MEFKLFPFRFITLCEKSIGMKMFVFILIFIPFIQPGYWDMLFNVDEGSLFLKMHIKISLNKGITMTYNIKLIFVKFLQSKHSYN